MSSECAGELQDLIAGQHQLAHAVHQLLEQAHIDADASLRQPGLLLGFENLG